MLFILSSTSYCIDQIAPFVNIALVLNERTTEEHLEILDIVYSQTHNLVNDLKETVSSLPSPEYR